MSDTLTDLLSGWGLPLAIVAVGIVIGLLVERIVLIWLKRLLDRSTLATPGRIVAAVRGASTEIVVLVSVYVALPWMDLSENARATVGDVLFVLVAIVATHLAARLAGAVIRAYMERADESMPASSIFVNIARLLVWLIGALVVMQYFGVAIAPLLTALGVGGFVLALALQDTLTSLFAGVQILAARQFVPGDFIELETGEAGEIVDITWRNTIIHTIRDNEVIIPNNKMASSIVTNYESPARELSILVPGGIAYGSDLEQVEAVTLEVAAETVREVSGEFEEYEPAVRFREFGDSAIEFVVVLRAREFRERYVLQHEFIKRLKKRFDEEGIEIPFPQRVVHMPSERSTS